MSLTKIVKPILDSRSVDVSAFNDVPVWTGVIDGEIFPKGKQTCFLGAWYRKVMSSKDEWLGMEGVVRLGEFTPDEKRYDQRYLDNPSVYMGGNAFEESDAGLGLNLTYQSNDFSSELNKSSPKIAWRPFWRYIYKEAIDIGGNVERREVNSWNISEEKSTMYYYFPGDLIRMKIYSPIPNYLQLRIELVETTTISKYVKLRQKYGLRNDLPTDFYSPIFLSEGHGKVKADFKRVNSIDQYGNEGFHAKPTDAEVSQAVWQETYLYRRLDEKIVKVPFSEKRQVSMICPNESAIGVETIDSEKGSERITIHPGNQKR